VKGLAIVRVGLRSKCGNPDAEPAYLKFERLWRARLVVGV
jgi:hypothetical protein